MRFGRISTAQAEGAILAHSEEAHDSGLAVEAGQDMQMSYKVPKGTRLTGQQVKDLINWGVNEVVAAWPDTDDVEEDAAASQLAQALVAGRQGLEIGRAGTGRVNLRAVHSGIVDMEVDAIHAVNRIDPGITVATAVPWRNMRESGLVATIKIIPFAVPRAALDQACAAARGAMGLRRAEVASASLIETVVNLRYMPADKGRRAVEGRLSPFGVMLSDRVLVEHKEAAITQALLEAPGELLLVLTGSATSDIADTAPEALRSAGGEVIHYGMPVDPGNLLFIGRLGEKVVIGLPGCARSSALNGADWVMERVICGSAPEDIDIPGMGVGGLLKEIPSRPRPREGARKG